MNKLKKVLIALDYDQTAQKVLEAGYLFAKTMGAEVVLLNVIDNPVFFYSKEYTPLTGFSGLLEGGRYELNTVEGIKEASHFFLDMAKRHLGDETIQTMVKEGDIADTILKTAKNLKTDFIVLGSHSKKWLENIIMGSETEKIMRLTTIPIFIVPTKKPQ